MSTAYYARLWLRAREDLERVLQSDSKLRNEKPLEDPEQAAHLCLGLYYRYRSIVRRVTECHDQLVQPQVRSVIGKMLDLAIVRMLELRKEIVDLTLAECSWPIEWLLKLKLTPDDVTPRAPAYDLGSRLVEMERRRRLIQDAIANQEPEVLGEEDEDEDEQEEAELASVATSLSWMTTTSSATRKAEEASVAETPDDREARLALEAERRKWHEALGLVQSHERARIGRRLAITAEKRAERIRRILAGFDRAEEARRLDDDGEPRRRHRAAATLQRAWRRFAARARTAERLERLDEAYGMTRGPTAADKRARDNEPALERQRRAADALDQLRAAVRDKFEARKAPAMLEDIKDEIWEWMMHWYEVTGYFDSIPNAEYGGTRLVVTGQARTPEEYTPNSRSSKDKKKPQEPDPKSTEEQPETDAAGWSMPESRVLEDLVAANREYATEWLLRTDRILDPENPVILEAVVDEICYELQLRMRVAADEEMRPQLKSLNEALAKDKAQEGFNPPEPENFEELLGLEPEHDKKKKKSKKLEKPDEFEGVPEDELLAELATSNVLREVPEEELDEWPGAPAYNFGRRYQMRLGDVKHPVIDYCVLPLGSRVVNELAPFARSVCICGPPNSGPLFLARAVCNELKATVFDLTPERHAGKFKSRTSQERLAELVVRLARSYAPSVILVENESAWLRNPPWRLRKSKPGRFLPVYARILRAIRPGDRVLFLTASSEPYLAGGPFLKSFDRLLVVPEADYGTLARHYRARLARYRNLDRRFDVSCLARLAAAARVPLFQDDFLDVPVARRMAFRARPLRQAELLERFLEASKERQKIAKQWDGFRYGKVAVERNRKRLEDEAEKLEREAQKKTNKNKKK